MKEIGQPKANIVHEVDEDVDEEFMFLTNDKYVDLCCSNHVKGKKELLTKSDTSLRSEFKMCDKIALIVHGNGIMDVDTQHGEKNVLDTSYGPNMKYNLLNVGRLVDHSYEITFKKDELGKILCFILKHCKVVTMVPMSKSRIFPLRLGCGGVSLYILTSTADSCTNPPCNWKVGFHFTSQILFIFLLFISTLRKNSDGSCPVQA